MSVAIVATILSVLFVSVLVRPEVFLLSSAHFPFLTNSLLSPFFLSTPSKTIDTALNV